MSKQFIVIFGVFVLSLYVSTQPLAANQRPPIYIAFHWHMHQPIYFPYQNVMQTYREGHFSFSLLDVHRSRTGPYTNWPRTAVQKGINAGMRHFGAQVSFSGSLIENLNTLENAGINEFRNWRSHWTGFRNQLTSLGNPRLDLVGFGYHHPLMALIDNRDIRRQVQWHRQIFQTTFPGAYSRGIFPPETAFAPHMIPALRAEGFEWVIIDNLHFERTAANAPFANITAVIRPNRADIRNPDPGDWVQLTDVWAPTAISAQWAHQPRYVSYTDPNTGVVHKMIGVPASRYLGHEDGRGGFGALNYESVLSQLERFNTDPRRPILVVLHHDGDNFGGGSHSYYNDNFARFVQWLQANPSRFVCTTIQDYLQRYPPPKDDVIHVQGGSWLGAAGGDPHFRKWNGAPSTFQGTPNYSPDRNSWGILQAAKNIVETAEQNFPNDPRTQQALRYYMVGQQSCYWYWDGTEIWDSNPVRAANLAVNQALPVINAIINTASDRTPPSIFIPQRFPYNPGCIEWDGQAVMPSDFNVWTYVYDVSGLQEVVLRYRVSDRSEVRHANKIYAHTAGEVGTWNSIPMNGIAIPSITQPLPVRKALEFSGAISGYQNKLIDYYVKARDSRGNVTRSIIQHVWVADGTGVGGGAQPGGNIVTWSPQNPTLNDVITITTRDLNTSSRLHWGVQTGTTTFQTPISAYLPANTTPHTSGAVQTPFSGPDANGLYHVQIGPFNNSSQVINRVNFVLRISDTQWNNNNGQDFHITINNNPSDNPAGANNQVVSIVNRSYTFSSGDFPFFPGISQAAFAGIRVVSLPLVGQLKYNNVPVVAGQDLPSVNLLVYTPPQGQTGQPLTSFSFRVRDAQGLLSSNNYVMSINVNSNFSDGISWHPQNPTDNDVVTIVVHNDTRMNVGSRLHWGVNGWQLPGTFYRPQGSILHNNVGPAVQTPFVQEGQSWIARVGPFNNASQIINNLNFVLFYGGTSWNNNNGQDFRINITKSSPEIPTGIGLDNPSDNNMSWNLYPNPMKSFAIVELPENSGPYLVELRSVKGSILASHGGYAGERLELLRNQMPSGVYIVVLKNLATGERSSRRLIVTD